MLQLLVRRNRYEFYLSDSKVNLSVETSFGENLDCIWTSRWISLQGFERLGYRVCFVGYVGEDFSGIHSTDSYRVGYRH
jgi:hypothetical protein